MLTADTPSDATTEAQRVLRNLLMPSGFADSRYAVYFVPPGDSGWWRLGSAWLGRGFPSGAPRNAPDVPSFTAEQFERITRAPRRYGFHATLKAPLRIAACYAPGDLFEQATQLATTLSPVVLTPLTLEIINGFMALTLARGGGARAAVTHVANQCVAAFDHLRDRATTAELLRRRAAGLTARQEKMLSRWGYPYVFDDFRFHMTLTSRLSRAEQMAVMDVLAPWVQELNREPLVLDALTVCVQRKANGLFTPLSRHGFDGSVRRYDGE